MCVCAREREIGILLLVPGFQHGLSCTVSLVMWSLVCCAAVAQQLQHFESEIFGNSVPSTPIINTAAGGVTFGFGYSAPAAEAAVPTFMPHPMAHSAGQGALFGSGGVALIPASGFVFGAAKHDPRAAMDQSMDSA